MLSVLTSLDSQLFRPNDVIFKKDEKVKSLILLAQGTADLYGFCKVRSTDLKIHLTTLPVQSWYGDF